MLYIKLGDIMEDRMISKKEEQLNKAIEHIFGNEVIEKSFWILYLCKMI